MNKRFQNYPSYIKKSRREEKWELFKIILGALILFPLLAALAIIGMSIGS